MRVPTRCSSSVESKVTGRLCCLQAAATASRAKGNITRPAVVLPDCNVALRDRFTAQMTFPCPASRCRTPHEGDGSWMAGVRVKLHASAAAPGWVTWAPAAAGGLWLVVRGLELGCACAMIEALERDTTNREVYSNGDFQETCFHGTQGRSKIPIPGESSQRGDAGDEEGPSPQEEVGVQCLGRPAHTGRPFSAVIQCDHQGQPLTAGRSCRGLCAHR